MMETLPAYCEDPHVQSFPKTYTMFNNLLKEPRTHIRRVQIRKPGLAGFGFGLEAVPRQPNTVE